MMERNSAKVLVVNNALIGEDSATGITLRNILQRTDKKCLLQVCTDPNNVTKNTNNIETIFLEFSCLERFLRKRLFKKGTVQPSLPQLNANVRKPGLIQDIKDLLRGLTDILPLKIPRGTMASLRLQQPQVIYTCGSSIKILRAANYFAGKLNVKIMFHLLDDWPETMYKSTFAVLPRYVLNKTIQKTNTMSVANFAISEALCNKYSLRFRKEYQMLMNPAWNLVDFVPCTGSKSHLSFVYVGSVALNRWASLLLVAKSIKHVCATENVSYTFSLYVPFDQNSLVLQEKFLEFGATLRDYVPQEKIKEIYAQSDVLIFAESFEDNICAFTKYSLSTKIPEYMASGIPILAFIKASQYSSEYLKKRGLALVANSESELETMLHPLTTSAETRYELATKALDYAKQEHSIDINQYKLETAIEKSIRV